MSTFEDDQHMSHLGEHLVSKLRQMLERVPDEPETVYDEIRRPDPDSRKVMLELIPRQLSTNAPNRRERIVACPVCNDRGVINYEEERQVARGVVHPYTFVARCRCRKGLELPDVIPSYERVFGRWPKAMPAEIPAQQPQEPWNR